jgi:hypothetical protein
MMDQAFKATEITVGFHQDGYRIDKTASPMNRYTKWDILPGNHWCNPKAVCFDSLPQNGWIAKEKFDWDKLNPAMEQV